ncbi:MAG TPA: AI-2E family transporter [Longimicrobium sp.]|jgi:predicted PurR-regulated permease PerM
MNADEPGGPPRTANRTIVVRPRRRAPDTRLIAPPPGSPTPILISPRTRAVLITAAAAMLVLLLYHVPTILTLVLGGAALALVLSFPVRLLAHVMPHWLAILLSFLLVIGLLVLAVAFIVPILAEQLGAFAAALPGFAEQIQARLPSMVAWLDERGLLSTTPERFFADLERNLLGAVESFARRVLGGLGQFISRVLSTAVTLFGILFLAVYFLADARRIEAATLLGAPRRYRRDVRDLWNAFRFTLSRYLGGLALSLAIQGGLSAVALFILGVPYALLLGVWVAITALVPYLGAWIGGAPAVLLALTISPTTALLTALLFLVIQQLEGNVLTPRIQGQAVRVHPILVFLAVIAGGELFGLVGIVFAVPLVAVFRVLFDFFRARLRVEKRAKAATQPV